MILDDKDTPAYRIGYEAGYSAAPRRNPGGWIPRSTFGLWFKGYDDGMDQNIAELEELDEPW